MEAGSDEEDFQFFGTPIEDEVETRVAQHSKKVTDVQATRALPLHKQASLVGASPAGRGRALRPASEDWEVVRGARRSGAPMPAAS